LAWLTVKVSRHDPAASSSTLLERRRQILRESRLTFRVDFAVDAGVMPLRRMMLDHESFDPTRRASIESTSAAGPPVFGTA
jgi:hypothetical protein